MQQKVLQVGAHYAYIRYTADTESSYVRRLRTGDLAQIHRVQLIAKGVHMPHPQTARGTRGVEVAFADGHSESVLAGCVLRSWEDHEAELAYWQAVARGNARRLADLEQEIRERIAPAAAQLAALGVTAAPAVRPAHTDANGHQTFGSGVTLSGLPLGISDARTHMWPAGTLWIADRLIGPAARTLGYLTVRAQHSAVEDLPRWHERVHRAACAVDDHRERGISWYESQPAVDPEALAHAGAALTDAGLELAALTTHAPAQWWVLAAHPGVEPRVDALVRLRAVQLLMTCGAPDHDGLLSDLRRNIHRYADDVGNQALSLTSYTWRIDGITAAHLARLPQIAPVALAVEEQVRAMITGPARTA